MISYGKTARCALAALCHLAKHYKSGTPLGSQKISQAINLPQTLVAKVLTTVSSAGFIEGTRGPKGGYKLSKDPAEINVYQVVRLFGKDKNNDDFCPMGPGWCGVKDPCPLHDTIQKLRDTTDKALRSATLDDFSSHT